MKRFKTSFGLYAIVLLALVLAASGCGVNQGSGTTNNAGQEQGGGAASPSPAPTETASNEPELLGSDKHPLVTIELSNDQVIKVELYPEVAPNTVNNFISLVEKGFYDGLMFHRVIPGFMIQGGDPDGNGTGGPGYSIPGEFTNNGFENKLSHKRGVISMARSNAPDSAGSQFFIVVEDSIFLDKQYAAFGAVVEGMEAADVVVNQDRDGNDMPLQPILMKKVTVDKKGMTFEEPQHAS
ncbi:peptidylprolyl isomerase [Paenibacillus sp. PL2-23]|uniref:peptidylprolyl isomerase n=1 Tax=Paenibacillus sp. PL2-23 TaxID=2100729 RepID=UPI0030F55B22